MFLPGYDQYPDNSFFKKKCQFGKFMNRKIIILLMIVSALFFEGVLEAMARPNFLLDFKNKYPETAGTRIDSCSICHLNKNTVQTMNLYGAAYLKSGNLPYLESNDSVYQKSLNFSLYRSK